MSVPFRVLHDDGDVVAIDKPAGIALFADRGGDAGLWPHLCAQLGPVLQVHRIDKGTSGVLLLARSPRAQAHLNRAFQQGAVRKYYVANVAGRVALAGSGSIDLPLQPGRKSRYRVAGRREDIVRDGNAWHLRRGAAAAGGHDASTRLRVLAAHGSWTRLLLAPRTGRTHQLRVHLAWIGHAIRGDHLYGTPDAPAQRAPRLELHCHRLCFTTADGRALGIRAGVPF